jgi:hypothetical protein
LAPVERKAVEVVLHLGLVRIVGIFGDLPALRIGVLSFRPRKHQTVGERHFDQPRPRIFSGIAPEKSGRGDLGWEHGAFLGVVDCDPGEDRRVRTGGPGETGAEDDDGCDALHRRH